MIRIVQSLLLMGAALSGWSQSASPAPEAPMPLVQRSLSSSEQFSIQGPRIATPSVHFYAKPVDQRPILVEPAGLVITCEKIKSMLLRELGVKDTWKGRVYIGIRPALGPNEGCQLLAEKFLDGWSYKISMPSEISKDLLVENIVQVLLLEMANRSAVEQSSEIPIWLVAGLTDHLKTRNIDSAFILSAPQMQQSGWRISSGEREIKNPIPWSDLHHLAAEFEAPSMDQLSWPRPEFRQGNGVLFYRACSRLLVHELLRLPEGRESFILWLNLLGRHLNWQTSFQKAFSRHFENPLALEKWWSAVYVKAITSTLTRRMDLVSSLARINALLRTPVEVRQNPTDLPIYTEATLASCLQQWDFSLQKEVLQQKITRLSLAKYRLDSTTHGLVDEYVQLISRYLKLRSKWESGPKVDRLVQETLSSLRALDGKQQALLSPTNRLRQMMAEKNAPPAESPGE